MRIVTVAGTVASLVSLLERETTNFPDVLPLRDTVAVLLPPFSEIEAWSIVSVKFVDGAF